MTDKITTTNPGERVISEVLVDGILIRHLPDDDMALRVSIGMPRVFIPALRESAYLVYRGDHGEIVALLRRALAALERE